MTRYVNRYQIKKTLLSSPHVHMMMCVRMLLCCSRLSLSLLPQVRYKGAEHHSKISRPPQKSNSRRLPATLLLACCPQRHVFVDEQHNNLRNYVTCGGTFPDFHPFLASAFCGAFLVNFEPPISVSW